MTSLRLVPVSGPAIDVVKDQSMVGRDPSCEIVVTDGSVSRRHARLERRAGAWWVVDQGSANGTYVNSLQVAEQALRNGQELRFGALAFRVDLHEDPEATVATPFVRRRLGDRDGAARRRRPSRTPAAPPLPTTPTPRPRRAAAPPHRRRPRPPAPPSAAAAKERFRARRPPRPCRRCPGAPRLAKKGKSPLFWIGDRLLRLPAARRRSRRRHRRRRLHGHEGRGRRHPRVARARAAGPVRRGRGRA